MQRYSSAEWTGSLKEGRGHLTTDSQALSKTPYSFATRFENEKVGTNPEELIAAAHAGCFSMSLSAELEKMNLTPDYIRTQASVELHKGTDGWSVTAIQLVVRAQVPGADQDTFLKAAETAKEGCPISRLLKATISMDALLEESELEHLAQANS